MILNCLRSRRRRPVPVCWGDLDRPEMASQGDKLYTTMIITTMIVTKMIVTTMIVTTMIVTTMIVNTMIVTMMMTMMTIRMTMMTFFASIPSHC